jgi:hypothetical protein
MGVEVKRCQVCHQDTEDDGYGDVIHKDTGLYGAYGGPFWDDPKRGDLTHVAV